MRISDWSSDVCSSDLPLFCFEGASSSFVAKGKARPVGTGSLHVSLEHRPTAVSNELLENCIASTSIFVLPSYNKPTVDALAPSTDEGREWLRKAEGSRLLGPDPRLSERGSPDERRDGKECGRTCGYRWSHFL